MTPDNFPGQEDAMVRPARFFGSQNVARSRKSLDTTVLDPLFINGPNIIHAIFTFIAQNLIGYFKQLFCYCLAVFIGL